MARGEQGCSANKASLNCGTPRLWLDKIYCLLSRNSLQLVAPISIERISWGGLALGILGRWIREALNLIPNSLPEERATTFVQLAALGRLLLPRSSVYRLTPARLLGLTTPADWLLVFPRHAAMRDKRGHYLVNDLLDVIEVVGPWALRSGVQFL